MHPPDLEVAKKATAFLHERLGQLIASREEWRGLPNSAEELEFVFKRASEQAESVYAEAVARRCGDPRPSDAGPPYARMNCSNKRLTFSGCSC